jgi:hypothetical protein
MTKMIHMVREEIKESHVHESMSLGEETVVLAHADNGKKESHRKGRK